MDVLILHNDANAWQWQEVDATFSCINKNTDPHIKPLKYWTYFHGSSYLQKIYLAGSTLESIGTRHSLTARRASITRLHPSLRHARSRISRTCLVRRPSILAVALVVCPTTSSMITACCRGVRSSHVGSVFGMANLLSLSSRRFRRTSRSASLRRRRMAASGELRRRVTAHAPCFHLQTYIRCVCRMNA